MRALETYIRTNLLPYDFSISAEQEADLFAAARSVMERATDEELFAFTMRVQIEKVVAQKLDPWREESLLQDRAGRAREIRESAVDYVEHFLKLEATPAVIDQLKQRFETDDTDKLKLELESRIRSWLAGLDDEQILNYEVFTVKDLVFSQLRSWC
jgi:hypothetical protein